jgi:hypothetical protein
MGLIDDVMDDDAAFAFFDADLLPMESITYTKQSGTTRTINAHIERLGEQANGLKVVFVTRVTVRNNSTYGIATSELVVGGDSVSFAYRRGGTARRWILPPLDDNSDAQQNIFILEGRAD